MNTDNKDIKWKDFIKNATPEQLIAFIDEVNQFNPFNAAEQELKNEIKRLYACIDALLNPETHEEVMNELRHGIIRGKQFKQEPIKAYITDRDLKDSEDKNNFLNKLKDL